jgi:hypothetical protein
MLHGRLESWLANLQTKDALPHYWIVPSTASPESYAVFPTVFNFRSLKLSMLYTKYWGLLINIHSSMIRVESFIVNLKTTLNNEIALLDEPPSRQTIFAWSADTDGFIPKSTPTFKRDYTSPFNAERKAEAALNICRTVDYVLDEMKLDSGVLYLSYPMLCAYYYFRGKHWRKAEAEWLRKKFWVNPFEPGNKFRYPFNRFA